MNLALLVLALFAVEAGASRPVVSVQVPETAQVVAGGLVEVQISVTVTEGYHLQANPASEDYLIPTRLELKASEGVAIGKITYPPGSPYRLNGADKELQTYDGKFKISLLLKSPSAARPGRRILQGRLYYQACDSKTCLFPTSVALSFTVNVNATPPKTSKPQDAN